MAKEFITICARNYLTFISVLSSFIKVVAAFVAFSFIASSGYIINDLMDLNADRIHLRKRLRPFASGRLSIRTGIVLTLVLFSTGIFIAYQLNSWFLFITVAYFIMSVSYSMYFKKIVLTDVFILAMLYSTRIVAGGLVTTIPISFWLIAFLLLFF